jgi:hypothetical protein
MIKISSLKVCFLAPRVVGGEVETSLLVAVVGEDGKVNSL